jgi:chromosomal replication initiation ATPase DnaA
VSNPWADILDRVRAEISEEDFRRWFSATGYASDSGDQITVWVQSDAVRRHLELHFGGLLARAGTDIGRESATIRFVVTGFEEDEEEEVMG